MGVVPRSTRPAVESEVITPNFDTEKGANVTVNALDKSDNASESDEFQDGVQRVRAITTIWTKWTMCSMFAL